jgi:putative MFS transporter
VLFVVSEAMVVQVPNVVWADIKDGAAFGASLEGQSTSVRAVVTAAPLLGNIFGGVFGGLIADTYGRHAALNFHSSLFVSSCLVSGLCQGTISFVLSRFALGTSLGVLVPVIVAYMAELSPSVKRARAVVIIPSFGFPCGQIVMLSCGLLLHSYERGGVGGGGDADGEGDSAGQDDSSFSMWRVMVMSGIVPNLLALVLVKLYVPESPHYLMGNGEYEEAERVIRKISQVCETCSATLPKSLYATHAHIHTLTHMHTHMHMCGFVCACSALADNWQISGESNGGLPFV